MDAGDSSLGAACIEHRTAQSISEELIGVLFGCGPRVDRHLTLVNHVRFNGPLKILDHELVESRRLNLSTLAAHVGESQVVGQDDDHVGVGLSGGRRIEQQANKYRVTESLVRITSPSCATGYEICFYNDLRSLW